MFVIAEGRKHAIHTQMIKVTNFDDKMQLISEKRYVSVETCCLFLYVMLSAVHQTTPRKTQTCW